jgi:hypothetical protein
MVLTKMVTRLVSFLRAGYPEIDPPHHYVPALALLRRRLTDDEVASIATQFVATGNRTVHGTDVRVAILKVTNAMPAAEDADRVKAWLTAAGQIVAETFLILAVARQLFPQSAQAGTAVTAIAGGVTSISEIVA